MPRAWLDAEPTADGEPLIGDLDFLGFDYREKDRNTVFDGLRQQLDLVAVMLTVIIAGVTGYVGINIMENTSDTTNLANTDEFFDAQGNLTTGLEDFFSNLGTVFVVIILVVVIGYLMLLRGR